MHNFTLAPSYMSCRETHLSSRLDKILTKLMKCDMKCQCYQVKVCDKSYVDNKYARFTLAAITAAEKHTYDILTVSGA